MILNLTAALTAIGTAFSFGDGITTKTASNPELLTSRGSMTELLGDFIVEPTIVVTESATNSEQYHNIVELNVNMFCTLYTNVFTKLVTLHGVSPRVAFRALSSKGHSNAKLLQTLDVGIRKEDNEDFIEDINAFIFGESSDDDNVERKVKAQNRSGKEVGEPILLNRNIEVVISLDGKDVSIPIIIRATVITVSTDDLIEYVTVNGHRSEFLNSWHRYRSKEDSLTDFLTARKLLNEYDKFIKNDKKDIIKLLEKRKHDSEMNNSATLNGFGRYYGSIIMSTDEVTQVNNAIRGDINREKDKNELFERIASFNMITINEDYETVNVYTSNIRGISRIPFKKLKVKKDDELLKDLFKSLTENKKIEL